MKKRKPEMKWRTVIVFLLLSVLLPFARPDYEYVSCSNATTYAANSTYRSNLLNLLSLLKTNSTQGYFSGYSSGTGEVIQGLYQCRLDKSQDVCHWCVSNATSNVIERCPTQKTAMIGYDSCFLRYSNETILSTLRTKVEALLVGLTVMESERTRFTSFVRSILNESITEVAVAPQLNFVAKTTNTYFNFSDTNFIYTLVQCTQDLSREKCIQCLQAALEYLSTCCSGYSGGRTILSSCFFRYEIALFYNASGVAQPALPPSISPPPTAPKQEDKSSKSNVTLIVATVASVCGALLLLCIGCYILRRRRTSYKPMPALGNVMGQGEALQFELDAVKAATDNFSEHNLLGKGGFGDVYKGTLSDGQEVAVKRLSVNSNQGATEFKNEVILLANLQHRNLARLLGFCIDGEEKILIYEFVANKSLDFFLFDREKKGVLDWPCRHKIIIGIARGILYLHEDSRLRIIHRDLKAANVLLDNDMNPKISDFGLAKLVDSDQTHASTNRIMGTYGYMPPEYAMHGQFSVKSDVYSFGILVLEIVTGRKITDFGETDGSESLVSFVWRNWKDQIPLEAADPTLREKYIGDQVIRCIHIGLLCVQENPMDRPTMRAVEMMLSSNSAIMTLPQQPVFFYSKAYQQSVDWLESQNSKSNSTGEPSAFSTADPR